MLLRVGAGVNAMDASIRLMLMSAAGPQDAASRFSRTHGLLASIGYLGEVVRMLNPWKQPSLVPRFMTLLQHGVAGGHPIPCSLSEAQNLLSMEAASLAQNVLLKVRDKVGFHWDEEAFAAVVDDPDAVSHTLVQVDGDLMYHRIFYESAEAFSRYVKEIAGGDYDALFIKTSEAQAAISDMVVAAWLGLLREAGEDPNGFAVEYDA